MVDVNICKENIHPHKKTLKHKRTIWEIFLKTHPKIPTANVLNKDSSKLDLKMTDTIANPMSFHKGTDSMTMHLASLS